MAPAFRAVVEASRERQTRYTGHRSEEDGLDAVTRRQNGIARSEVCPTKLPKRYLRQPATACVGDMGPNYLQCRYTRIKRHICYFRHVISCIFDATGISVFGFPAAERFFVHR
jgi:hypothetical protein